MSEGIDFRDIVTLLKEYENVINTLNEEIEFYKIEHVQVKSSITELLSENKNLAKKIAELNEIKINDVDLTEINLVDNLKNQLKLTLKEKESAVELWQNALRNIDHLEEELCLYQGRTHGYVRQEEIEKLQKFHEAKVKNLEMNLAKVEEKVQVKAIELDKALEGQRGTLRTVTELEDEVKKLQKRQQEIVSMRDQLERRLNDKNKIIEELRRKEVDAKAKVSEALQIVEAAFVEKDAALMRENEAKDEVTRITKALSEIVDETGGKVKCEIEAVKKDYNNKLKHLISDTKSLQDELAAKNSQLDNCTRECKLLEQELDRIRRGNLNIDDSNTSKLLILEKNLESTFQKLLLSERKNLQLASERDSIKTDLEQMGGHYERDIKAREVEKRVLGRRIQKLEQELNVSNSSFMQVAGKVEELNSKLKHMDAEIRKQIQLQDVICEATVEKKVSEVQQYNVKVRNELENYLKIQLEINRKWQSESKAITKKLEDRIQELKAHTRRLSKINKLLAIKLDESHTKVLNYKNSLEKICSDVQNVATISAQ